jgi:hypothetical protein
MKFLSIALLFAVAQVAMSRRRRGGKIDEEEKPEKKDTGECGTVNGVTSKCTVKELPTCCDIDGNKDNVGTCVAEGECTGGILIEAGNYGRRRKIRRRY